MATIIGLAGKRRAGKSIISKFLKAKYGFQSYHPFQPGKAASVGLFEYIGIPKEDALRMVDGDLKDVSCDKLPIVNEPGHKLHGLHADPRYWMEKFGKFMGVEMGSDWTLGLELSKVIEENPDALIVVESIVYEAETLRDLGGTIIMVERDSANISGVETDKATALLQPDIVFENHGDDIEEMLIAFEGVLSDIMAGPEEEVEEPMPA